MHQDLYGKWVMLCSSFSTCVGIRDSATFLGTRPALIFAGVADLHIHVDLATSELNIATSKNLTLRSYGLGSSQDASLMDSAPAP